MCFLAPLFLLSAATRGVHAGFGSPGEVTDPGGDDGGLGSWIEAPDDVTQHARTGLVWPTLPSAADAATPCAAEESAAAAAGSPFWLNRGSGLPAHSTTAAVGLDATTEALIITIDASDALLSQTTPVLYRFCCRTLALN